MTHTDTRLQWFAGAVRSTRYPDAARLILYPDGRVRTYSVPPDLPDAYHLFCVGDFR